MLKQVFLFKRKSWISWSSIAGRFYGVQSALKPFGPYITLISGVVATPPENSEAFSEDTSIPHFYRVVLE